MDWKAELVEAIEANTDKLAELQKDQLERGVDGQGDLSLATRGAFYQPATIAYKKIFGVGLGAETDRVTNYMTGNLYAGLQKKVVGETIETMDNVSYFDDVKARSSASQFDLGESSRLQFAKEVVLPTVADSFLSKTGISIKGY